jgi:S-adenosylmethionine:tRNA ribosyltransferase-isomerase
MRTADFDYLLPPELIAQHPPSRREDARLLVLSRESGEIEHLKFPDILRWVSPGDLFVFNDTRVLKARLFGKKTGTGGKVEVLLLGGEGELWRALLKPSARVSVGAVIEFGPSASAELVEKRGGGEVMLHFRVGEPVASVMEKFGCPPLPPYIRRKREDYPEKMRVEDTERYQTVFARVPGAVAAPTAGFHFTPEIMDSLRAKGVGASFVTLHVGTGTFRPVTAEAVADHRMDKEFYEIPVETAAAINSLSPDNHLWLVGTTVVRTLESASDENGKVRPGRGSTGIFIFPGYRFQLRFNLVTNFHLPCSTLLMLVSALAGREKVLDAYREAVALRYRFYSFGDAMLLL